MSPYFEVGFFEFFYVFFARVGLLISGKNLHLAEDEVQLIILALLSISCCFVGTFLVLRKMTMFANSLSHTILVGVVIAFIITLSISAKSGSVAFEMNQKMLVIGALLSAGITYLLIEFFQRVFKIQKDASIGFAFTFLFAIGVLLVTLFAKNSHLGVEVVMGNLDALDASEIKIQAILTLSNILLTCLFYRTFVMTSFDSIFSKNFSYVVPIMTFVLTLQTAFTTIGAYKVVGALLFLTFLTAPVLAAKVFAKNLKSLLILSCSISMVISFIAVVLSRHILSYYNIALSTGGLCSVLLALSFPSSLFLKKTLSTYSLKRHLKAQKTSINAGSGV